VGTLAYDSPPVGTGRKRDVVAETHSSFLPVIDSLELTDRQRSLLRDRWLNQVAWMEKTAKRDQRRYYALRLTAILGAVLVPALVGPSTSSGGDAALRWVGLVVSVVVAATTAVEGFLHYGDRWRHYRSTAERLKSEGWQYFELTGAYGSLTKHADGFRAFTERVEKILGEDVRQYLEVVTADRGDQRGHPRDSQ
jgi:hypothetical protein